MSISPSIFAGDRSARRRWLWHLCGALGTLYFLLFWIGVFTPYGSRLPLTCGQALLANLVALVLSLAAAILASRHWYFATGILALNLLFTLYANGV